MVFEISIMVMMASVPQCLVLRLEIAKYFTYGLQFDWLKSLHQHAITFIANDLLVTRWHTLNDLSKVSFNLAHLVY
jgi:hypothetical protein